MFSPRKQFRLKSEMGGEEGTGEEWKGREKTFSYVRHHLIRGLTREAVASINLWNNVLF